MNNKPLYLTVLASLVLGLIGGAIGGKMSSRYAYKFNRYDDKKMMMRGDDRMPMKEGMMKGPGMMMGGMQGDMQGMMDHMMGNLKGKTGQDLEIAFLKDMIVHHQGAIDMAKALQAGTDRPELEKLANDIITAQTGEITQMQTWLKDWYSTPTSTQAATSTMPMHMMQH